MLRLDLTWLYNVQTLRALLPRSNARLLPVLREDGEGSEAPSASDVMDPSPAPAASEESPPKQRGPFREGSPVQMLLSSIGIQIPTGDYQEGEMWLLLFHKLLACSAGLAHRLCQCSSGGCAQAFLLQLASAAN